MVTPGTEISNCQGAMAAEEGLAPSDRSELSSEPVWLLICSRYRVFSLELQGAKRLVGGQVGEDTEMGLMD